jgi:hypothetical protein
VSSVAVYKQTPIYITEADPDGCAACPATSTPADAYRYSPAYGAYEISMMKHTLELEASMGVKVGGLLTWAFTFPGTPYFAGYRALATNGISLPVLAAFKLLGSLAGTRLPLTSSGAIPLASILANSVRANAEIDAIATINGQKIQVLVWNYHDDLVATAATPVQLTVKVPASFGSSVTVTHLRVDDTHGDAYTVWTAQGSPAAPSATQIQALRQAMDPVAINPPQTLAVAGGSVTAAFSLPRFGISLVTITPGVASQDAGPGPVDAAARDSSAGTTGMGGMGAGGVGAGGMGAGGVDTGGRGAGGMAAGGSDAGSEGALGGRGGQGAGGSLTGRGGDSGAGIGGSGGGSASIGQASGQAGCSCETAPAGLCQAPWVLSFGLALVGLGARRRRSGRRRPTEG